MSRRNLVASAAVLIPWLAGPALAPALAQESVTRAARDAFGERIGIEQVGLYSEGQVRGFNLQNSGAYRIDGHYFVRHAAISDAALDGVGVRVGLNAARLELPSPSGVVNYRLRDTAGDSRWHVGAGVRDYETPYLDLGGVWVSADDRFGASANLISRPDIQWPLGSRGEIHEFGSVLRWSPSERLQLRGLVSVADRRFSGDFGFLPTEASMPVDVRALEDFNPDWASMSTPQTTWGVLAEGRSGAWSYGASAFRAAFEPDGVNFTLLRIDRDGRGQATLLHTPSREYRSDSFEVRAARVFDTAAADHRLSLSARRRDSRVTNGQVVSVDLGPVDIRAPRPRYPEGPVFGDDGRRSLDQVEQATLSAGYGLSLGQRFELRLGAHRTSFEKSVTPLDGSAPNTVSETLPLYNASALFNLDARTAMFASWVTGLEETGSAPQNATNRGDVLPPVEAEQLEFGARRALTDRLSLIGAVFDVSKATTGFRADGSFGLVGEVRHRGVEASLSGELREGTSLVLGAVLLDGEVSGPLVDAGTVGPKPAGLSEFVAVASIDHRLAFAPGWSVDAAVNHWGERAADTRNRFSQAARTMVDVGTRYRFPLAGGEALLRLAVVNLFDERGWWADPGELIWPVAPRTYRASLTVRFAG